MSARILVVDDIAPNIRLLEAKLSAEYFEVLTAQDGAEALDLAHRHNPDLILLDVMMPGIDGFEVCKRLKADPRLTHIPVIMVTALNGIADRVHGLEAGADDFLTKPVDDIALFARVRSLLRLKLMMDELRLRDQTSGSLGFPETPPPLPGAVGEGRILLVEDFPPDARRIQETLVAEHQVTVQPDGGIALAEARRADFDLVVVSLELENADGLRLCSQLRSAEETRHVPILVLVEDGDRRRMAKALEIGVNDYLLRPIERNELLARTRTQLRRKRYQERLRANYHRSVSLALTDGLTGLFNRRYLMGHLETLMQQTASSGRTVAVLMLDIDSFKSINDGHGHAAGDEVLREFAVRANRNVRGVDLAARYGGEEFVVVMPDAEAATAMMVAERLRRQTAEQPFAISAPPGSLWVTCSIGVALSRPGSTADELLGRADRALYEAKNSGRDRVVAAD